MSLRLYEQEILIRRCADEDMWDVESSMPLYTRHLRTLAHAYGIPLTETQHGVRGKFPRRLIGFRKPVSEERRRRGQEQAKVMRSKIATQRKFDTNTPKTIQGTGEEG